MRTTLFLLVLLSMVLMTCNNKTQKAIPDCYDPAQVQEDAMCTMDYNPVCGCNGKTYSNACMAKVSGILKWEKGTCEDN
ncbi:MAG: Kazal-type serine protease inhibitor domain-containing protein [Bacteroidota bacterium]